jgi:signal transduction histidine kinase
VTAKAPKAPYLAALLDESRDEITLSWAKMSQEIPGSRYAEYTLDQVRSWLFLETEATIKTLSTGSYEPTETYLRDIALGTLESGFGIAEVIEGLLLFRQAALPVIRRAYAEDEPQLDRAIATLDAYLRLKVGRFGHLYAEAKDREMRRHVRATAAAAERSRLARELHDSVTQALYSVNLHAEAASLALAAGNEAVVATSLQKLQAMTQEAMLDLRMLIFELHPPILKEEGLAAALRARLATVETRAGLHTEFQVEGEEHLPLGVAEELFWIAVEAFNNVLKHAQAHKVKVDLSFARDRVRLSIADDGRGFDPAAAGSQSGMGLRSIGERVERIGGRLDLSTAPGRGTTVCVEVQIGVEGGDHGAGSDSSARR